MAIMLNALINNIISYFNILHRPIFKSIQTGACGNWSLLCYYATVKVRLDRSFFDKSQLYLYLIMAFNTCIRSNYVHYIKLANLCM